MTKKEAAERLVNAMSAIPTNWIEIIAEKTGDEFYGIGWGTMFLVNNSIDKRKIEALLKTPTHEDEDDDMNGAKVVEETGIYAFYIDDELVLGINGAGYDFYEAHWIPLYEALGYNWHDSE